MRRVLIRYASTISRGRKIMPRLLNRDQDRARRAARLEWAGIRSGDRRKMKRAKRLRRQVFCSQMASLHESLRRFAVDIGPSVRAFSDAMSKLQRGFQQMAVAQSKGAQRSPNSSLRSTIS
jgi:hypothetical protein